MVDLVLVPDWMLVDWPSDWQLMLVAGKDWLDTHPKEHHSIVEEQLWGLQTDYIK